MEKNKEPKIGDLVSISDVSFREFLYYFNKCVSLYPNGTRGILLAIGSYRYSLLIENKIVFVNRQNVKFICI